MAFLRMSGAFLHSIDIAIDKAYSAASFRFATEQWPALLEGDAGLRAGMPGRPRLVVFGGGVPIFAGPDCVGGIGVSGGLGRAGRRLRACRRWRPWALPIGPPDIRAARQLLFIAIHSLTLSMTQFLNFIHGEFVATGKTFENRAPVDNRVLGLVHEAGRREVDAAVASARAALKGEWGSPERGQARRHALCSGRRDHPSVRRLLAGRDRRHRQAAVAGFAHRHPARCRQLQGVRRHHQERADRELRDDDAGRRQRDQLRPAHRRSGSSRWSARGTCRCCS